MPSDAPGAYLVATLDGHDAAAVAPADDAAETTWRTYVACDDADATASAVAEAGGTVLIAPEDAGPGGRTATCADPQGAVFHLWQARRRLGAQVANQPGAWNFSILHTPDPGAVLPFYAAVFGWAVDPELGAGMIRLPGYGDHLAATVDPHIHERQQFAPPGFADVVAGVTEDADPDQAGMAGDLHRGRPRRQSPPRPRGWGRRSSPRPTPSGRARRSSATRRAPRSR